MPYKKRIEKDELKILRSLHARMQLKEEDAQRYFHLEKGFKGELMFDSLTDSLPESHLVLNDLLLESNNSKFQLDTTSIVQQKIFLLEVKNMEGNYYYESDKLYTINGKEINNPLDQIKRSESQFRQLLQQNGYRFPIESFVVFVNPAFTLYQSPKNLPFVFPTQLNAFMKKLLSLSSTINSHHKKLADTLVDLHIVESPYPRLPKYEFPQLKKGILCPYCYSFMELHGGHELVCSRCGAREHADSGLLRSTREFQLLFPKMKTTTNTIHDWCQVIDSPKTIRRVLKGNFDSLGMKNHRYYV